VSSNQDIFMCLLTKTFSTASARPRPLYVWTSSLVYSTSIVYVLSVRTTFKREKSLDYGTAARFSKALETFGAGKVIFVHLYVKTEKCIRLKLLV